MELVVREGARHRLSEDERRSRQGALCAKRSRQDWPVQRPSGSGRKFKDSEGVGRRGGERWARSCSRARAACPWRSLEQDSRPWCKPVAQALPPAAALQSCPLQSGIGSQVDPPGGGGLGGLHEFSCHLPQGQELSSSRSPPGPQIPRTFPSPIGSPSRAPFHHPAYPSSWKAQPPRSWRLASVSSCRGLPVLPGRPRRCPLSCCCELMVCNYTHGR